MCRPLRAALCVTPAPLTFVACIPLILPRPYMPSLARRNTAHSAVPELEICNETRAIFNKWNTLYQILVITNLFLSHVPRVRSFVSVFPTS
jgi:hypothetical protein